jgi:hypothetical protein
LNKKVQISTWYQIQYLLGRPSKKNRKKRNALVATPSLGLPPLQAAPLPPSPHLFVSLLFKFRHGLKKNKQKKNVVGFFERIGNKKIGD